MQDVTVRVLVVYVVTISQVEPCFFVVVMGQTVVVVKVVIVEVVLLAGQDELEALELDNDELWDADEDEEDDAGQE